ncbi:MAG: (d)CMP kinase [Thermodesulfobacteriota bacterium]
MTGTIITLDGPAASGKSTVAKRLAELLGYIYIDSGAMYRAIAFAADKKGIGPEDVEGLARLCAGLPLKFVYQEGEFKAFYEGGDISAQLRSERIGELASLYSVSPVVRDCLTGVQRELVDSVSAVLEGRDAGTVVCPEARFKFYLTATAEVRVQRRHGQLAASGKRANLDIIGRGLNKRDRRDRSRKSAPLAKAPDSLVIDSSHLSADQVVEMILQLMVQRKAKSR